MCKVSKKQSLAGEHNGKLPAPEETSFKMPVFGGVFNIVEWIVSLGRVNEDRVALGMDLPTSLQVKEFFVGLLLPFYSLFRAMNGLGYTAKKNILLTFTYFSMFVMWIVFFALTSTNIGYAAFGWSCFFINACILTYVRSQVRQRFSLDGNVFSDFLAGSFLYPQGLCQIMVEFATNDEGPEEMMKTDKVMETDEVAALEETDEGVMMEADEGVVMEGDEAVVVDDTADKGFTA
jgi:Cys-rich protein (TIGR01571 family)